MQLPTEVHYFLSSIAQRPNPESFIIESIACELKRTVYYEHDKECGEGRKGAI